MSANNEKERRIFRLEPDDRKVKILKAIIKSYMETGEPVGSRTISKIAGLNLSSATIRNEMSDLEDMGYIIQPHTSAGRIPSDKGYRFYVDEILKEKQLEMDEFKEFMAQKVDKLEVVLQKLAKIIATNTNYATMISGPSIHGNKLKFIQLSAMEKHKLLLITVLEGNIINNKIIDVGRELADKELFNLNLLLNTSVNGLGIDEINLGIITKLKEDAGEFADIADKVISEIAEVLNNEDFKIYTSGATNIFKYPELSDKEKASQLINAFEEKDKLREIFNFGITHFELKYNPVQSIKIPPKPKSNQKRIMVLHDEDLTIWLNFVDTLPNTRANRRFKVICDSLLASGMRINELLALTIYDLDFESSEILVTKTLVWKNANPKLGLKGKIVSFLGKPANVLSESISFCSTSVETRVNLLLKSTQ